MVMRNNKKEIIEDISFKEKLIIELKDEIKELYKEFYLYSDEKRWYSEELVVSGRKRKQPLKEELVGYTNWIENFKAGDNGEVISVTRKMKVKIDGEWVI
jgi:hypothetical protein